MRQQHAEFERRGVTVAVVSFAAPAKLVHYQEHHRWPFIMLADPERKAYETFALKRLSWFQVFSPAALKLYWKLLRSGMKQERYEGDDIYQSGGDFLLDCTGNILFAHRGQNPADRPAPARLLMAIDRIEHEP
ncbi:MAG: redoxin domain-containing protein [Candidatus Binatota bacterium]|nr:redoxin domain-containing protein [Candidatus Binatota bacterium]